MPAFLARWCPAYRRREPGLRLLHGTGESESPKVRSGSQALKIARGSAPTQDTGGAEYRWRRFAGGVVKLLLAGVGVERRGRLTKDMSTTINHDSGMELWEESK